MPARFVAMCLTYEVRVYAFTAVLCVYFVVELLMSHVTHSLTLLTDAYHTLYNIVGILGFVIAMKMSHEHKLKNTFGWARIGVLGMLVSTLALAALSFSVVVEAMQTTIHASHSEPNVGPGARPGLGNMTRVSSTNVSIGLSETPDLGQQQEVDAMHHPMEMLGIGIIGIVLNLVCFLVIGGLAYTPSFVSVDRDHIQVNVTVPQEVHSAGSKIWLQSRSTVKAADVNPQKLRKRFLLDFCRDMSCSFLVVICALVVDAVREEVAVYVDPAISVLSVIIMMATTYPFFKESGMILLQSVPSDMDIDSLIARLIKKFPSIINVHDLHVWRLTRTKVIATAHIRVTSPWAYTQIASGVNEFFDSEGITLSTIQPEFQDTYESRSPSKGTECILHCQDGECQSRMCCKTSDDDNDGNASNRSEVDADLDLAMPSQAVAVQPSDLMCESDAQGTLLEPTSNG